MPATRSLESRRRAAARLLVLPGALFFGAIFIYPMIRTVLMSVSDVTVRTITADSWKFIGLANFEAVASLPSVPVMLRNTVIFLVASVIPQIVIAFFLAVALRRATPFGTVTRALVLLPWLLPSVATAAIFLFLFDAQTGLVNWLLSPILPGDPVLWFANPTLALVVIILVNIWIGIPFNFLVLQSGLQALPEEVHEAAAVDGAGWFREMIWVTVPMMKESFFAVAMLGIIGTLKVFDFVWIMTGGGPANGTLLPGLLAYQLAFVGLNYGAGSAVIVVMVVVMALVAITYLWIGTERSASGPGRKAKTGPGRKANRGSHVAVDADHVPLVGSVEEGARR
jgi:multiple sugar transport system permease protein